MNSERRPDSARLFVAVELPDAWRAALAELQQRQERASPGYFRWAAPAGMHVTLLFMGSQPRTRVAPIGAAVARAAAVVPPFRLALGSVGSFGPPRAPRVLWVEAVQAEGRLQQLRRALDAELSAIGAPFDARPLRLHVTLGRARRGAEHWRRTLTGSAPVAPYGVQVIVLFESHLGSGGPRYDALLRAPLRP